jgi:DNA-binding MarR family transcriptional regulator/GNAT superfamily N-acetyltransferase
MSSISAAQIDRVRAFNRDYTRRIGVLSEGLLDSAYSLTEARVMYEIAHRHDVTAGELAEELNLDRGYLSRILKGFETRKLVARTPAPEDGRRQHLRLTPAGTRAFVSLETSSREQVRGMLAALDDERRRALLEAMDTIQNALGEKSQPDQQLTLRGHRPGDMGWVVQRHGEIYHQEYGWNEEFEALVAEITAEFVRKLDVTRERCWIAEHDGRRVGCIFLVGKDATTAKLRLLLVEPDARGLGVGRTLVAECVRFAREAGYQKILLWTQENLTAARRIYKNEGFVKTAQEPHHSFGHDLVGETWELELRVAGTRDSPGLR